MSLEENGHGAVPKLPGGTEETHHKPQLEVFIPGDI